MQVYQVDEQESRAAKVLALLFVVLLLVAPFYYQDNLGGEGLNLPFNSVVWIPAVWVIAGAMFNVVQSGVYVRPRFLWFVLAMPLGLWLTGILSGMDRPSEWLIRLGVVFGGVGLWLAVLQYRVTSKMIEPLLYLLLASLLIHALVGFMQMFPQSPLTGWIPVSGSGRLLGMFQQPNLQASLMATAIALSCGLAALESFSKQRWPFQMLIFLTLFLASLEVTASGSRVGMMGAVIAIVLLAMARWKVWSAQPKLALALVLVMSAGVGFGLKVNNGAVQAYNKIEKLAQEGQDARPHIYRIAYDVFERSWLVGHGIGSFQREFQNERVTYYETRDASAIDGAPRFSHPHNELLFWMSEGGFIALLAIGSAVMGVLLQLIRLGWAEGLSGAALLTPIALHTQTELPFYISTFHWIVFVILLVPLFLNGAKEKPLILSAPASGLMRWSPVFLVPLLVGFLTHSLVSQTGVMAYFKQRGAESTHLRFALNNIYFKELGEYFVMRGSLYGAVEQNNRDQIQGFIEWASVYLEQIPDIQLYRDLAIAYQSVDDIEKATEVINRGHAIYPKDRGINDLRDTLARGERWVPSS